MKCTLTLLAWLLACAGTALGYPVGPAVSLEKLTEEADIVFKGTAVSGAAVQDEWFKPYQGFVARQTQFKIISVVKGDRPGDTLAFRHYDEDPKPYGRMFQPQFYHFVPGKTYLVFAKKGEAAGSFRQLWMYHKGKEDQGVFRCPNDKPATGDAVKDVVWNELTTMLGGRDVGDAVYAIGQLDQMSDGQASFGALWDFDRTEVLTAVRGLMGNREPKIARAVIELVGSHNPYMSDERTVHWLATVGSAKIPGIGTMDPKMKNVGGELYWKDLVALADGKASDEIRAKAILALGLVRNPSLQEPIERWLNDSAPAVRAAAAVLLADYPGPAMRKRLAALADDASPDVRVCVARAVGFSQQAEAADVLAKLLADKDFKVRQAAAMGLLSFSPDNEAIAAIFRANLGNAEFKPLFLIALARDAPAKYLDALAKAVEEKTEPKQFWGGQIPAFTAWEILFRDLQGQSADELRSGKLDRYLDAMEKVGNYSSSEPRDIYAFYLQCGMAERAKKFRRDAIKAASYDLDYYFKQVDANPSQYKRDR